MSRRCGSALAITVGSVALAGVFAAYHVYLSRWIAASGKLLGALHPRHAVPLYSNWHDSFGWSVLPAAAALALLLLVLRGSLLAPRVPAPLALAVAVLSVAPTGLAVASIDPVWSTDYGEVPAFQRGHASRALEYFGDVRKVDRRGGPRAFVRLFTRPEYHDRLSLHSGTHPPGPVLFLWLAGWLFGPGLLAASLASIGFTALGLIPAWLLARDTLGEPGARVALLLMLLAPSAVLFTTTSMDGPFSVLPITAVWLFHRSLAAAGSGPRAGWALASGAAIGAGLFMSYVTFFSCLYFAVALLLLARRGGRLRLLATGAASLAGFAAFEAALIAATGYQPVAALELAVARDRVMMGSGHESPERWLQIGVANLAAFFIGAGLPLTLLWWRQLLRALRRLSRPSRTRRFVLGYAAALLLIAFSTLFTLEVERIWLGMLPFLAIPAARELGLCQRRDGHRGALWATSALLCLQTLAMEASLNTRW